jgi:TPR repeat protein
MAIKGKKRISLLLIAGLGFAVPVAAQPESASTDDLLKKLESELDNGKLLQPPGDNVFDTASALNSRMLSMTDKQLHTYGQLADRYNDTFRKKMSEMPSLPSLTPRPIEPAAQPALENQQYVTMAKQADEKWKENDISGARRLWEYLANKGSATAARRLAQSYDPRVIHPIGGIAADRELASKWYSKAAELGDSEAQTLLASLSQNNH